MNIEHFYIAGINYKKSDACTRGKFAVTNEKYNSILETAAQKGMNELFILSTCNRTEIYGFAASAHELVKLLCNSTSSSEQVFHDSAYIKQGKDALLHLFSVAAGLDSQILGDYEIVGQIKQSLKFAREKGFTGTFTERLLGNILQASKEIKNKTRLSGGTISVAFAAIQFLNETVDDLKNKKIVLLGTGKIGKSTCKNLIDYTGAKNITLINRSEEKANTLAEELNLQTAAFSELNSKVNEADIVIVATAAEEFILTKENVQSNNKKILLDLSIPNNIDPSVKTLTNIVLANVDDLSKINDNALEMRKREIPKAKKIIGIYLNEFLNWHGERKNVPALKAAKQKLNDMQHCELYRNAVLQKTSQQQFHTPQSVQKVINAMAVKMRSSHQPGCNFIEAINDFISNSAN